MGRCRKEIFPNSEIRYFGFVPDEDVFCHLGANKTIERAGHQANRRSADRKISQARKSNKCLTKHPRWCVSGQRVAPCPRPSGLLFWRIF